MEKIAEKQKTGKKERIVLKDPSQSYYPEGYKTNLPITATTSSSRASLGVFGKNISEKVSVTKETEYTPKQQIETEPYKKAEKTQTIEIVTKTSPETGEKVIDIRPISKIRFLKEEKSVCKIIEKQK